MQMLSFHPGMAGRMCEALHRVLQVALFFLLVGVPLWSVEAESVTTDSARTNSPGGTSITVMKLGGTPVAC